MPRYSTKLSAKGFRKLAEQVKEYRESLPDKCKEFARKLAEEGVYIAQMKITSFDAVLTGKLLRSMNLEQGDIISNGARYYIYTDCDWAAFVEFGTGIEGLNSPHPDTSLANWKYDTNNHGEKGWFYFVEGEGDEDGAWHWTKGMPSRPFMYETAQELSDMDTIKRIARKVFKDD